jgi:hypothetical protein
MDPTSHFNTLCLKLDSADIKDEQLDGGVSLYDKLLCQELRTALVQILAPTSISGHFEYS